MKHKVCLFTLAFFAVLLIPVDSYSLIQDQNTTNAIFENSDYIASTVSSDQTEQITETSKQSKEKKRNKVEINDTFYYSLLINIAAVIILVVLIYFPSSRKQEVLFTFILFNIAIFLLTFLLNEIKISMGAAFGLFAVFSMLRYRTEGISMKDMTYLFIVIALGLINAIQLQYDEMLIINSIIVIVTFILDGNVIIRRQYTKKINYENIDFIKPEMYEEMIHDLRKRTGLDIYRAVVRRIDLLKDTANVEVFYRIQKK